MLAELLIDRVIVTGDQAEIRYVLPTSPKGPHRPFCQLRKDHLDFPPLGVAGGQPGGGRGPPVCQGGDQAAAFGAGFAAGWGDGEVGGDDADRQAGRGAGQRPAAVAGDGVPPAGRGGGQHRPVRPVREHLQHG